VDSRAERRWQAVATMGPDELKISTSATFQSLKWTSLPSLR
jgi:hypothetical protein